jgi:cytidylate kinase
MTGSQAIAIDGPVASGKTAVGGLVAKLLGCGFLDTGLMYRAVTQVALDREIDLQDVEGLTTLAENLSMEVSSARGADGLVVEGEEVAESLRDGPVERGVSLVASVPGVRRALVRRQRDIAAAGPIVMMGRDIGTVVLTDAAAKVYLTASVAERARRRHLEFAGRGNGIDYEQVLDELQRRDAIDSERFDSPLRPADDAVVIETGGRPIEEIADEIVSLIRAH